MPHIVFSHVFKTFELEKQQVHALSDVSFSIEQGDIFGIIGRSGAGKSTLLRMINALEVPSDGQVQVHDQNPAQLPESALVHMRRKIGMIFQHFNLLSAKTVFENVALPLKVAGWAASDIYERVHELLRWVGLADKAQAYPSQLSGGQKQRVGIARALVHSPDILLCDEATSALDPETTDAILELLKTINRELRITIVLITHDMGVIRRLCDRVLVLDQGKVQETGEVWRVFGAPGSTTTRSLLHTLQASIPPDLAVQLQPEPDEQCRHAIVCLGFTGLRHPDGLSLQVLQAVSPSAQWIYGGLDRLGGHSFGRVLLKAPIDSLACASQVIAATRADFMEIVGYVRSC